MDLPMTSHRTRVRLDDAPWYRQRWPWLIMLGPFLVVLAAVYSGYLAFSRQDAMVVDDYYAKGKAINQDLRRDRVAIERGLTMRADYDAINGRFNGVLLEHGQPMTGAIHLHLAHPTQPEKDRHLVARLDPQGRFSVPLPLPERARWTVLVEGDQRDWRLNGDWSWPQQQQVQINADLPPGG
ncbi:hypothetical protein RCH09_003292 [Actimicrobium sp. GrIS 1.19]|nr:hypothetical protein [Actimicrobium sp. GrIS 1.19]